MDAFSAGFDISTARFIFSNEWLLLGGTSGNRGCLQIRSNEFVNGVDGAKRFEVKANYIVGGFITCVELCSIERLGKMVIVIGGTRSTEDRTGFVEIVDLRIQGGKAEISPNDSFGFLDDILRGISGVTSIVFKEDREVLIFSTDDGEVIVIDLYGGKELYRDTIDSAGISKLQFSMTGQLVTLGHSSTAPVKIWDLRFKDSQVLNLAMELEVPISSPMKSTVSFRDSLTTVISSPSSRSMSSDDLSRRTDFQRTALQSAFTCMTVHPTQDRILLGNTTGAIVLWDLRTNATVAFHTHSSSGKNANILLSIFEFI